MMNKRQWRNTGKRVFKVNDDLDKSFRLLYGVTNPIGCSVCSDDDLDNLGIHKIEGRSGLHVLCRDCNDKMIINNCNLPEKYNITREGVMS